MSDGLVIPVRNESGDSIRIGQTFTGFLEKVAPPASRESLTQDAVSILSDCAVAPAFQTRRTGLVVGRVQSGKTLSYEAVIALARDNGFALVIVISGISNPLLDQGVKRLRSDLTAADSDGWNIIVNPGGDAADAAKLQSVSDNWADPDTPPQLKKTAVCLLLKHHGRIGAIASLCAKISWSGLKVLIIDDEADQASLNTLERKGRESATFRNILDLRNAFPHHAYLQYTATPQAPLLIAISNALSPDFVRVIEPGAAYVGGPDFFGSERGLVKVIDDRDLEAAGDPSGPPPASLSTALREFLVGAADVVAKERLDIRSMLVHPSRLTEPHAAFVRWVNAILSMWRRAMEDPSTSDGLKGEFEEAWASIKATDPSLSEFEACWRSLKFVMRNLQTVKMNSSGSQTPVIEWDNSKAYVLVGGQALDRGFTVNGLSVTYMSRDPGSWTADTIQQRARFFGYKRDFLGQCRIYIEPTLRDAFTRYVDHEAEMLKSLRAIQDGSLSLPNWKRNFLLDPAMRPTRQSVVSVDQIRVKPGERWIYDPRPPRVGATIDELEARIRALLGQPTRRDEAGHDHYELTIDTAISLLDTASSQTAPLTPATQALELQLARLRDSATTSHVPVYWMRADNRSERTLTPNGFIQPFQGKNSGYVGDRNVFEEGQVSMQIHSIDARREKDAPAFGSVVVLATRIPDELADSWLIQQED